MIEYKVKVTENSTTWFNLEGKLHREDGPAVEYTNGYKSYYIKGRNLTEEEFNNRTKTCEGKIVEIEGVKYKLSKV